MAAKQAEKERIDKERFQVLKQKEVQRITEERRRNQMPVGANAVNGIEQSNVQVYGNVPTAIQLQQSSVQGNAIASPGPKDDSRLQIQKSSSIVNMFGERLRRVPDNANVKRAESMKIGPKIPKRTPSFTTRRRAQSFRKNQQTDQLDLPPVEIQGKFFSFKIFVYAIEYRFFLYN